MCGRYRLSRRKQLVEEYFGAVSEDCEWNPRYNVAPSQSVLTILQDAREPVRKLSNMRWGLVPSWAKDPSIGYKTINARAETVSTTASFREPFKSQRCLIPADGFYEWKREGNTKQPYCFEVNGGELFAFAGLWDRWTNQQEEVIETCTIMTTTPNPLLTDIHDRMPAILRPDDYDLWLDPSSRSPATVSDLLMPFDAALMRRYPVSTRVNQVQNDDVDCAKHFASRQSKTNCSNEVIEYVRPSPSLILKKRRTSASDRHGRVGQNDDKDQNQDREDQCPRTEEYDFAHYIRLQ